MTKKHFIAFAEAIAAIRCNAERKRTANLVATVCRQFNYNFDSERFYTACGLNDLND